MPPREGGYHIFIQRSAAGVHFCTSRHNEATAPLFDRHTPLPDKLADWLLRPVRNFQAAQTDREIEQTLSEQGARPLRRNEPALGAYECLYAIAANHDLLQPSVFERSNGVFDFAVDQG